MKNTGLPQIALSIIAIAFVCDRIAAQSLRPVPAQEQIALPVESLGGVSSTNVATLPIDSPVRTPPVPAPTRDRSTEPDLVPSVTSASTTSGERLPQLNFVVDVLALLTTILAIVSGYTVYRSHREAGEAKRAASSTLDQARSALTEARTILTGCTEIKAKLQKEQDQILNELVRNKASFEEEMKKDKTSFEQELKQAKSVLAHRMEAELDLFRNQLHEATTINRTKGRLMELLSGEAPKAEEIFPLLTDILNYPDQRSIEIYERLLQMFANDGQIVAKVCLGLQNFRERHYERGFSLEKTPN